MAKRADGEGTLRKRSDGRWEGRIKLRGKLKYVYAKTQKECKTKLAELIKTINENEVNIDENLAIEVSDEDVKSLDIENKIRNRLPITLNEWFDYYINEQQKILRDNTLRNKRGLYNTYVKKPIGNKYINTIDSIDITSIQNSMVNKKKSDKRINDVCYLLKNLLEYAQEFKLIKDNPLSTYKKIKTTRDKKEVGQHHLEHRELTSLEVKLFFDSIKANRNKSDFQYNITVRDEMFFKILLNTGMRVGECCALRWRDIDENFNYISVNGTIIYTNSKPTRVPPKTKTSVRSIPINSILKNDLKKYFEIYYLNNSDDYMFYSRANRVYHNLVVMKKINKYIKYIQENFDKNFLPFSSHCFRHTFCSRAVRMGLPIKEIQAITGHSNANMLLNVYSHSDDNAKKDVAEKIAISFIQL